METKRVENLKIENAHIVFRNFSGTEGRFNAAGNRNFCVFIDDPVAVENLRAEGWNVKFLRGRDPEDPDRAYMKVNVKYGVTHPDVFVISGGKRTELTEETIGELDHAEISNIDLIIRPYSYDIAGARGISAYLKTMYVTIVEDEFAYKYRNLDIPEEVPFN